MGGCLQRRAVNYRPVDSYQVEVIHAASVDSTMILADGLNRSLASELVRGFNRAERLHPLGLRARLRGGVTQMSPKRHKTARRAG